MTLIKKISSDMHTKNTMQITKQEDGDITIKVGGWDAWTDDEVTVVIAKSFAGEATESVYGPDGQPRCTEYVEHGQPIPYRCPNTPDIFGDGA